MARPRCGNLLRPEARGKPPHLARREFGWHGGGVADSKTNGSFSRVSPETRHSAFGHRSPIWDGGTPAGGSASWNPYAVCFSFSSNSQQAICRNKLDGRTRRLREQWVRAEMERYGGRHAHQRRQRPSYSRTPRRLSAEPPCFHHCGRRVAGRNLATLLASARHDRGAGPAGGPAGRPPGRSGPRGGRIAAPGGASGARPARPVPGSPASQS